MGDCTRCADVAGGPVKSSPYATFPRSSWGGLGRLTRLEVHLRGGAGGTVCRLGQGRVMDFHWRRSYAVTVFLLANEESRG